MSKFKVGDRVVLHYGNKKDESLRGTITNAYISYDVKHDDSSPEPGYVSRGIHEQHISAYQPTIITELYDGERLMGQVTGINNRWIYYLNADGIPLYAELSLSHSIKIKEV